MIDPNLISSVQTIVDSHKKEQIKRVEKLVNEHNRADKLLNQQPELRTKNHLYDRAASASAFVELSERRCSSGKIEPPEELKANFNESKSSPAFKAARRASSSKLKNHLVLDDDVLKGVDTPPDCRTLPIDISDSTQTTSEPALSRPKSTTHTHQYNSTAIDIESAKQALASAISWHETTSGMVDTAQKALRSAYHHHGASLKMVKKAQEHLASLDTNKAGQPLTLSRHPPSPDDNREHSLQREENNLRTSKKNLNEGKSRKKIESNLRTSESSLEMGTTRSVVNGRDMKSTIPSRDEEKDCKKIRSNLRNSKSSTEMGPMGPVVIGRDLKSNISHSSSGDEMNGRKKTARVKDLIKTRFTRSLTK